MWELEENKKRVQCLAQELLRIGQTTPLTVIEFMYLMQSKWVINARHIPNNEEDCCIFCLLTNEGKKTIYVDSYIKNIFQ